MPYIPKKHEKYNLLPLCREDGGEVFDYPSELIVEVEQIIGTSVGIFPYNFNSYDEYFTSIDELILNNANNSYLTEKLHKVKEVVQLMNQKEEWSILKYIGPTDNALFGLTHGKNYYWPTRKENPVYNGVIDDEEFTTYLYPTEEKLWEILEDPTGMAKRTIYEKAKGYLSQEQCDDYYRQIKKELERIKE